MNRPALIEAMARAICANEYRAGTWDESPVLRAQCIRQATAALSAIEAMAVVVVERRVLRALAGACESGQVVDKDVAGELRRLAASPFAPEASDDKA